MSSNKNFLYFIESASIIFSFIILKNRKIDIDINLFDYLL